MYESSFLIAQISDPHGLSQIFCCCCCEKKTLLCHFRFLNNLSDFSGAPSKAAPQMRLTGMESVCMNGIKYRLPTVFFQSIVYLLSFFLPFFSFSFFSLIVQELCESRGGRPGLSVLTSLLVSVDVKLY